MPPADSIDPMLWIILIAATVITLAVMINKAVKTALKLAVIGVMALFVIYFLKEAGIILIPASPGGN